MSDTYTGKPIGVSNLTMWPVTADPVAGATTYGEAQKLARAIQVRLAPQFAEGLLESDNSVEDEIALLSAITVTIDASQLTDEVRSALLGHKMDSDGGMVINKNDVAPPVALGFKVLLSKQEGADNKYAYVVLYKGRFREFEETFQTMERGSITFQTHTGLEATFVPRDSDGHVRYSLREDSAGFSATKAAAWFTEPQEPTEEPAG